MPQDRKVVWVAVSLLLLGCHLTVVTAMGWMKVSKTLAFVIYFL